MTSKKMTDRQWYSKIKKMHAVFSDYQKQLEACEAEYERRFGNHPSDVDDDQWIDSFHVGNGECPALEDIVESAKVACQVGANQ
jgi:hypothetical protein